LAAELAFWKQSRPATPAGASGTGNSARVAELEEALRGRDAQLSEQAARLESLLWRVAELEPFAAEAPQKEEILRRQEAEIAGHMAVHDENASQIRLLQSQMEELQATTIAEHQAALQGLLIDHQQRVSELEHAISMKEEEIAEHVSVRYEQAAELGGLQTRVAELEAAAERARELEQSLADREIEHQIAVHDLLQNHEEKLNALRSDLQEAHAAALETAGQRVRELEQSLADLAMEHRQQLGAVRDELLHSHMQTLEIATQRMKVLEQSLSDRDIEIRALLSVHSDMQREMEATRRELQAVRAEAESQLGEVANSKARLAELEAALSQQTKELKQQKELNHDKDGQLTFLHERLGSVSSRLAAHQQRLLQLEPLAARAPEMEQRLKTMETKHHADLTRLKVNSAQRIRRFRQSLNTFKT
jgi:chromosome segregation ATPase